MDSQVLFAGLSLLTLPVVAAPYTDAGPAVVQVHVYGTLKKPLAGEQTVDYHDRGTGFLVSPNGLILSAGHNIPDRSLFDEDGFYVEGFFPAKDEDALTTVEPPVELEVIVATQSPYDVALLRIKSAGTVTPFLRLCDGYQKGVKTDFEVLGYQGGDRFLTSNFGPVMAGAGATSNILVQMPLNKGNSGGPIFNERGMVFGIAIGEKTVNSERMQLASMVVPMAKVMKTLGDKSKPLAGVSYDPDCQKTLNSQLVTDMVEPIAMHDIRFMVAPREDHQLGDSVISAPTGYRFVGTKGVTLDRPKAQVRAEVSVDGDSVLLKGSHQGTNPRYINAKVRVVLEQTAERTATPVRRVQSFPYSHTLDEHTLGITRKDFRSTIPAPQGFVFEEIVKLEYVSLNHSPSRGATLEIVANGSAIELAYSLESGPSDDKWKGWIDAFVTAKLKPID